MSVNIVGLTMSCPSSMAYSDTSVGVFSFKETLQVGNLALALEYVHVAVGVDGGHTGAVVSSVFQSVETFDYDWTRLALSYVSYNTTHKSLQIKQFTIFWKRPQRVVHKHFQVVGVLTDSLHGGHDGS